MRKPRITGAGATLAAIAALGLAGCGSSTHHTTTTTAHHSNGCPSGSFRGADGECINPNQEAQTAGQYAQSATTPAPPPPPSCTATGFSGSSCTASGGTVFKLAHGSGTLHLPGLSARISSVTTSKTTSNGPGFGATATGEFVIIALNVTNTGGSPQTFGGLGTQTLLHVGSDTFSESFHAENGDASGTFLDSTATPIQPGEAETGKVIFDVPPAVAAGIATKRSAGVIVGKFGDDLSAVGTVPSPLGLITLPGAPT